ncbi:hypothetical protein [Vibrio parahaemolyticus]
MPSTAKQRSDRWCGRCASV